MTPALHPVLALLVHSDAVRDQGWPPGGSIKVLSLHAIKATPSGPALDAGRLLSAGEAKTLGALLLDPGKSAAFQRNGLLPPHLLRQTPSGLTWYRPPARTTQYWRTPRGRIVLEAVLPGLVFHVEEGVLHVAAYAAKERPSLQTRLFHAPLGNVYSDTHVCTGNATLPRGMEPDTVRGWERVLLDTNYAHVNHEGTLAHATETEDLIRFWQKRKRYATPPDARLLRDLNMTLSVWLDRVEMAQ